MCLTVCTHKTYPRKHMSKLFIDSPGSITGHGQSVICTIDLSLHCTALVGNILQCPLKTVSSAIATCYSSFLDEFHEDSVDEICQYVSVLCLRSVNCVCSCLAKTAIYWLTLQIFCVVYNWKYDWAMCSHGLSQQTSRTKTPVFNPPKWLCIVLLYRTNWNLARVLITLIKILKQTWSYGWALQEMAEPIKMPFWLYRLLWSQGTI